MAGNKNTRYISIAGRLVPLPTYEHDIDRLVTYYRKAMLEILNELYKLDTRAFNRLQTKHVLREVQRILKDLDIFARDWIEEVLTKAAKDGVALSLFSLYVVDNFDNAEKIAKFNKINEEMVKHIVADTQADLLQITQNVSRKVRNTVRQVTAEIMRSNFTKNVNGIRTNRRQIVDELRKKLGASVETGIIDSAGRRWKPEFYVDTVVRTKIMEAHIEAATNEALANGAKYGMISSHNAKDACRFSEGAIVKLDPSAEGNYRTVEELKASGTIFHPRCRHVVYPVYLDDLPKHIRERAEKQSVISSNAVATGKRNPTDAEVNP